MKRLCLYVGLLCSALYICASENQLAARTQQEAQRETESRTTFNKWAAELRERQVALDEWQAALVKRKTELCEQKAGLGEWKATLNQWKAALGEQQKGLSEWKASIVKREADLELFKEQEKDTNLQTKQELYDFLKGFEDSIDPLSPTIKLAKLEEFFAKQKKFAYKNIFFAFTERLFPLSPDGEKTYDFLRDEEVKKLAFLAQFNPMQVAEWQNLLKDREALKTPEGLSDVQNALWPISELHRVMSSEKKKLCNKIK